MSSITPGSTKERVLMLYFNTNVGATLVGKKSPFPLALDDPGSVLAVQGSLRRFAPWTAPGRSEG